MKKQILKVLPITILVFVGCAEKAPPVIELNGEEEMIIYLGDTYTEPGATATDYKGRDISDDIDVMGSVGENAGFYNIDYTVTDKKGNFAMVSRGVARGYKNSHLEGTYDVTHSANNGGGTYTFTATVTAESTDEVTLFLDNTNCPIASCVMEATIDANGLQFTIPDQTTGGHTISQGNYNNINGGSSADVALDISFKSFNGSLTYNHTATWTKQ